MSDFAIFLGPFRGTHSGNLTSNFTTNGANTLWSVDLLGSACGGTWWGSNYFPDEGLDPAL